MAISPNKRIAINTGVLYIRVFLVMFITLFSTRYILKGLGESDFGLYNLIAGVVALFSFISGSMAASTQRFISFELGKSHDIHNVKRVFNTSLCLHLILSIIVILVVSLAGILMINYVLNIPPENHEIARWVLILVSIGLFGTILTAPYEAVLMAHENILFYAIVNIIQSILRLGVAVLLIFLTSHQLIIYAILMAAIPLIALLCQALYCRTHYNETRIESALFKVRNNPIAKEMASFSGYALFGNIGWTIRIQGFTIIINLFWGVLMNAANGIANQVSAALLTMSSSLTTSLRPQLIQAAGSGDKHRLMQLTLAASRLPSIILSAIGIPLFIGMPYILNIWLTDVPDYSILFCRILVLDVIINQSTFGLALIMDAKGEIKYLHSLVCVSMVVMTMVAFTVGYFTHSVLLTYGCILINDIIIGMIRITIVRHYTKIWGIPFNITQFILKIVLLPVLILGSLMTLGVRIWNTLTINFWSFLLVCAVSALIYLFLAFTLLIDGNERQNIIKIARLKL